MWCGRVPLVQGRDPQRGTEIRTGVGGQSDESWVEGGSESEQLTGGGVWETPGCKRSLESVPWKSWTERFPDQVRGSGHCLVRH